MTAALTGETPADDLVSTAVVSLASKSADHLVVLKVELMDATKAVPKVQKLAYQREDWRALHWAAWKAS